ncbi:MAG TPA: GldG family protein [Myxococcota bacterium]|jgi:hypothetical protein|nr:GldG family protein [Myxococcota bacterium]
MRELALTGLILLLFGLGARYATGQLGAFTFVHVGLGATALVAAALLQLRRWRGAGTPAARRLLLPRLVWVVLAVGGAVAFERAVSATGARLDWTVDGRFVLAPATREALAKLDGPLVATLFHDRGDPRTRRVELLLESLAEAGPVEIRSINVDEAEEELERFGVTTSNAVVLEYRGRFALVPRATEGALLDGIRHLLGGPRRTIYAAIGEGEGDLSSGEPFGFSGFAEALRAEGYDLREIVLAAAPEIPPDAAALLLIGPQRALRPEAVAAIEGWLGRGGRLVALLEPGVASGVEPLLERYGFALPDGVVVDPESGPIEGGAPGLNPVLRAYGRHPITRGLDERTMTFFLRARPVIAEHKPAPDDTMTGLAFTGPHAWLDRDVKGVLARLRPTPPRKLEEQRFSIAAAGSYPRAQGEARVVVFGDSDFATNQYLRALYNLDLVMNAVHWATDDERKITLRPKAVTPDQDPLTPQQTLTMLYGVGLLIPELLLIGGALAWLRTRSG